MMRRSGLHGDARFTVLVSRLIGVVVSMLLLACASRQPLPEPAAVAPRTESGEPATVALLGATGMVGNYLLEEALARGHPVRALARNPAKLDAYKYRVTIIPGDARDPAAMEALLRGSDVVISALGPVKADGDAARFINTDATANVLRAMQTSGVTRYLVVSGAAVDMPGDERDLLGWWIRTLARIGLRDTLRDRQAEYELLASSPADWTLVRCPLIDPLPFRAVPLYSTQTPPAFRLRAGELARFLLDAAESGGFVRQGPFLGSRGSR